LSVDDAVMEATTEAGARWAEALAAWAIPEGILAQAASASAPSGPPARRWASASAACRRPSALMTRGWSGVTHPSARSRAGSASSARPARSRACPNPDHTSTSRGASADAFRHASTSSSCRPADPSSEARFVEQGPRGRLFWSLKRGRIEMAGASIRGVRCHWALTGRMRRLGDRPGQGWWRSGGTMADHCWKRLDRENWVGFVMLERWMSAGWLFDETRAILAVD